jgi:phage baseplate assembly protein W
LGENEGKNEELGIDLKLNFFEVGADLKVTKKGDYDTIAAEDNLAQAIITRLATDEGELYDIGHADFGSRLFEVIGEINNGATRNRIKAFVRQCLTQERRVKKIISINVSTNPYNSQSVDIEMTILPIKSSEYLTIVYPFSLEG